MERGQCPAHAHLTTTTPLRRFRKGPPPGTWNQAPPTRQSDIDLTHEQETTIKITKL